MKTYILSTFSSTSLRQSLKHRFCLEQAASVPLLRYLFNFSIRPKGRIEKKIFLKTRSVWGGKNFYYFQGGLLC